MGWFTVRFMISLAISVNSTCSCTASSLLLSGPKLCGQTNSMNYLLFYLGRRLKLNLNWVVYLIHSQGHLNKVHVAWYFWSCHSNRMTPVILFNSTRTTN